MDRGILQGEGSGRDDRYAGLRLRRERWRGGGGADEPWGAARRPGRGRSWDSPEHRAGTGGWAEGGQRNRGERVPPDGFGGCVCGWRRGALPQPNIREASQGGTLRRGREAGDDGGRQHGRGAQSLRRPPLLLLLHVRPEDKRVRSPRQEDTERESGAGGAAKGIVTAAVCGWPAESRSL